MFRVASIISRNAKGVTTRISRSLASRIDVRPTSLNTESEEEAMLRSSVARFVETEIEPLVEKMDRESHMPESLLKSLFDQGLMGIETPTELGGSGLSLYSACVVIEELAKVDPSVSVLVDVQNTLVNGAIRKWGNEDQKKEWLPKLATNMIGSFCLSEAGSGSDAFALQTRAKQDGDKYIINGSKMWITNAEHAGVYLVFANVAPEKGYKGITAFIVPRSANGVSVGKKEDKLGIRASSTCVVNFEDVVVDAKTQVLGKVGEGYKIAIGILNEGRIGIGAQMLGLAEGVFARVMPYLHQRKQFGQKIANFQGMQFEVAEVAMQIEASRLMVYNAARMAAEGLDFVVEAAMAKYTAARTAELASSKAIEWMGGVGFTKEGRVEKFWRDSKIGAIYEGTHNLQKETIAKFINKRYQ